MTTLKNILPIFKSLTKGATRPILSQVYVSGGAIKATDLETSIVIKTAFGLNDGLHVVKTLGLVDGVNDEELIADFPHRLFPASFSESDSFTMNLELIESLLPFASKDETRINLNSIAINDGHFVACDGHTLKAVEIKEKATIEGDYVIPRTSMGLLVRLLKKYKIKGDFKCLVDNDYFYLDTDYFTFSARLIQRQYVKWSSVIPKSFSKTATIEQWIDFKELKPLLNTRKSSRIEFKNGEVTLIIAGYENNKYTLGYCDKELDDTIGFNLEFLNRAAGKQKVFNFQFNNELAPVMVNNSIIMPLRL